MRFRDIFFRNFWWKLASVVLATLIWFNYELPRSRSPLVEPSHRQLELSVVPVANTADVRQFKTDPATVFVRLEGKENELKFLKPKDLHARVFLSQELRTNGAVVTVDISGLPPGVSVIAVVPEEVKIYTPPGP